LDRKIPSARPLPIPITPLQQRNKKISRHPHFLI
jgi:hypothetical protein